MKRLLQESEIVKFFSKYPLLTFDKGEKIKRPFESTTELILVKSGVIGIYKINKAGAHITTCVINGGYVELLIGPSETFNQLYTNAITETKIWKAPLSDFTKLSTTDQKFTRAIVNSLISVIEILHAYIMCLKGDAYNQVISQLLFLYKTSGDSQGNQHRINIQLTHQDLADITGLARETISRQIHKLEEERLITFNHKNIVINNLKALEDKID